MASKNMKTLLAGLSLSIALVSFAGTTRYVSPDATGAADEDFTEEHPGTLQNAIAASTARTSWDDGDEIVLLPSSGSTKGIYDCTTLTPNMTRWAYFFCNKKYLKIRGYSGNRDDIEFRGFGESVSNTARCFRVTAETSFSSFTVRDFKIYSVPQGSGTSSTIAGGVNQSFSGGIVASGAAICASHDNNGAALTTPVVSNCAFYACKAGHAGAVHGCTIRNSYFYGCMFRADVHSVIGGGGAANARCYDCVFDSCSSATDTLKTARGGGTHLCNNTRCLFTGCRAYHGAATGVVNKYDTAFVNTDCVFSNNTVVTGGNGVTTGGISRHCLYIDNKGSSLTYGLTRECQTERCLFVRNNTSNGLVGGKSYNSLIVNNVCTSYSTSGKKALVINGYFYNCTVVSNRIGSDVYVFGGASKAYAYNCLAAANYGGKSNLGEASYSSFYNCVADREESGSLVVRDYVRDNGVKNGLRRGVDPSWGIPDLPVGIKPRSTIRGAGLNKNGAGTPLFDESSLDYAGKPRLRDEDVIDIGCHSYAPVGLWLHLQ